MTPIDLTSLTAVGLAHGRITHDADGTVIHAGPRMDAFMPPDGTPGHDRLPGLRWPVPAGPWVVAVRVEPAFVTTFDAGALMLRSAGRPWAKFAHERAPDGRAMAVSVVTRDVSDDANGPVIASPALHLRAVFTGSVLAFHISQEGGRWDLVRLFALPEPVIAVEFIAQSPLGEGCAVRLAQARWTDICPADLRDGS